MVRENGFYKCENCGWNKPITRGHPPKKCPNCVLVSSAENIPQNVKFEYVVDDTMGCRDICRQSSSLSYINNVEDINQCLTISEVVGFNNKYFPLGKFVSQENNKLSFNFYQNCYQKLRGSYLVLSNNKIIKIGSTSDNFMGRVNSFLSGNPKHSKNNSTTNQNTYENILICMRFGHEVEIWVYPQEDIGVEVLMFGIPVLADVSLGQWQEYISLILYWKSAGKRLPVLTGSYGLKSWIDRIELYIPKILERYSIGE